MKRLLLASLLLGLIPTANAGVYYYLNYSDKGSIKVKCADGKANHLVDSGSDVTVQLKGHGESKYKNPEMSMEFPYGRWANPENNMCVYKYLDEDQDMAIRQRSIKRCVENIKYCPSIN